MRTVDELMGCGCFVCRRRFTGTASAYVATIEVRLIGDTRPRADTTTVLVCGSCGEALEAEREASG